MNRKVKKKNQIEEVVDRIYDWWERIKETKTWHFRREFRLAFMPNITSRQMEKKGETIKSLDELNENIDRRKIISFDDERKEKLSKALDKYLDAVEGNNSCNITTLKEAKQALKLWRLIEDTEEYCRAKDAVSEWQKYDNWQRDIKAGIITYDEKDDNSTIDEAEQYPHYSDWQVKLKKANSKYATEARTNQRRKIEESLFNNLEYAQQAIIVWKKKIRTKKEWSKAKMVVAEWAARETLKDEIADALQKPRQEIDDKYLETADIDGQLPTEAQKALEEWRRIEKWRVAYRNEAMPNAENSWLTKIYKKLFTKKTENEKVVQTWNKIIIWEKALRESKTRYEQDYLEGAEGCKAIRDVNLENEKKNEQLRIEKDVEGDKQQNEEDLEKYLDRQWEPAGGFEKDGLEIKWHVDRRDGVNFKWFRRWKFINECYQRFLNLCIDALILANLIAVVVVFFINSDYMHQHAVLLNLFFNTSVIIFAVEIGLRMWLAYYEAKIKEGQEQVLPFKSPSRFRKYRRRWAYYFSGHKMQGWNVFDFVVTLASVVALFAIHFDIVGIRSMRLLRLANIFRAFDNYDKIRQMFSRILTSLKGIFLLLIGFMLLYIFYAIVGVSVFHSTSPEYFGSMGRALYTLFQVMTLNNWSEISDSVMVHHSWAWLFFVSFIIIAVYLLLNIMVGIIVDALSQARQKENNQQN